MHKNIIVCLSLIAAVSALPQLSFAADALVFGAGRKVKLDYTIKSGEEILDTTQGKTPIEFDFGNERMLPAFQKNVEGMKAGDEKTFTLGPGEAFGERNPQAIQVMDRAKLPPGDLAVGAILTAASPDGKPVYAQVTGIDGDKVTLDFNHPLAGNTVNVDVKVLEVM